MAIFGIPEARHFCAQFGARGGHAAGSFRQSYGASAVGRIFAEGSSAFNDFRDCSLREVERMYFLSLSNYRRSFDLMATSACSWAHVTMYYASFFAATSLLGMFGVWQLRGNRVLDVVVGTPGAQQLAVRAYPSTYNGSHQRFWDVFYANMAGLSAWIDPSLRFALTPITSNVTWPIDARNDLNYDSYSAFDLMVSFQTSFRRSRMRTSLPGKVNTQFRLMEALIAITSAFARQLKVDTDALNSLPPVGNRRNKVRNLVLSEIPSLGIHARRRMLLA